MTRPTEAGLTALAIRRQMAADFPDQPDFRFQIAASLGNIGNVTDDKKHDYVAALAYYREAETTLAKLVREHPEVVKYREYLSRGRSNLAVSFFTLGQVEAALAMGQTAEPYLISRIKAEPNLVQAQIDLAHNLAQQAKSCLWLRRYDEAEQLGQRAEETLASIPATSRGLPPVIEAAMTTFTVFGDIAASRGSPAVAAERYSRSILAMQPDSAKLPADSEVRKSLANALRCRAEASARLGRLESARTDWSHVLSLREKGDANIAPLGAL